MSIELGCTFLGPKMLVSLFFLDSLTTLEDQLICHIYQWVAHPTDSSVCNYCNRMMDGFTIDDLISGSMTGFLTQEVVVAYVRGDDPTNQDWDDWPLRMTFRINSFLRANRDNPHNLFFYAKTTDERTFPCFRTNSGLALSKNLTLLQLLLCQFKYKPFLFLT